MIIFVVGKAAVRSEKRANPSLFSQNRPAVDRSSLSATLSADGKAAVELYKVRQGERVCMSVCVREREEEIEREREND